MSQSDYRKGPEDFSKDQCSSDEDQIMQASDLQIFKLTLVNRLGELSSQLTELHHCYHFYHPMMETLFAHTDPWRHQPCWRSGLATVDDWLLTTTSQVIEQIDSIVHWIEQVDIHNHPISPKDLEPDQHP